jgi:hypothetical protein
MNGKSTVKSLVRKPVKPAKPRPDFSLYAYATKKWARTIRGKTFLGVGATPKVL